MNPIHRVLRQLILGEKIVLREPKTTDGYVHDPYRWVVTYEVGGRTVKYFRWDMDEVWKWTKTLNMASLFPSEDTARMQMESCEVAWRYQYEVRKILI